MRILMYFLLVMLASISFCLGFLMNLYSSSAKTQTEISIGLFIVYLAFFIWVDIIRSRKTKNKNK